MAKSICLNMIVKDEAHIIEQTLENLYKYIKFNFWVISDTGSKDQTKEIIKAFFEKKGIPGILSEDAWQNFGYNRTLALEKAYDKTDYVLMWDADDEIKGDFVLPEPLTADWYKFKYGNENGFCLMRPQLFNNRKRWKYVGVLHEYAQEMEPVSPQVTVQGNYYFTLGHGGNRSKDPNKYLNDALVLEKAFYEAQEKKDPIHSRYAYYCANSYRGAQANDKAIEFYKKTLTLSGWLEEKYVSCFRMYDLMSKKEDGLHYLVQAYKYNPKRVEAIYRLCQHYCVEKMDKMSYAYYTLIQDYYENNFYQNNITESFLSVNIVEYTFYFPYYMIIIAERTKHYDTGIKMYRIIFKYKYVKAPQWWVNNIFTNLQFYYDRVTDKEFFAEMRNYVGLLKNNNLQVADDILEKCKNKEASL